MSGRMSSRIEIVSRVSGRRRWTVEQKLAALRDAFGPEGCVRTACERHEVGSGSIYTWRRQAMSGELTGVRKPIEPAFAQVQISERSEEHTSELQSLMRISYAVFCLKKKKKNLQHTPGAL